MVSRCRSPEAETVIDPDTTWMTTGSAAVCSVSSSPASKAKRTTRHRSILDQHLRDGRTGLDLDLVGERRDDVHGHPPWVFGFVHLHATRRTRRCLRCEPRHRFVASPLPSSAPSVLRGRDARILSASLRSAVSPAGRDKNGPASLRSGLSRGGCRGIRPASLRSAVPLSLVSSIRKGQDRGAEESPCIASLCRPP